jgi:hypothetical protein
MLILSGRQYVEEIMVFTVAISKMCCALKAERSLSGSRLTTVILTPLLCLQFLGSFRLRLGTMTTNALHYRSDSVKAWSRARRYCQVRPQLPGSVLSRKGSMAIDRHVMVSSRGWQS